MRTDYMQQNNPILDQNRYQLGQAGETQVVHYLVTQGFTIKERNYRKRYGEIDIIAQKDELLVFVEVKIRRQSYFNLSEIITRSKQRKIIHVACEYISRHQVIDKVCRFDVALLEHFSGTQANLTYYPHAFAQEGW